MEEAPQWHDTPTEILGQRWTNHGDGRQRDASSLVARVNADPNGLGQGYSDWRLPTEEELRSLYGTPQAKSMTGAYWSSSPDVGNPNHAWYVVFGEGISNTTNRNYDVYVRLVR